MNVESFSRTFLNLARDICNKLDETAIDEIAVGIAAVRERGGRLFVLGVGGSAGNASHAVNDFRKLCDVEAYAPTDNVSELTARTNDEGWETVFAAWLKTSRANAKDGVLVFSVGGGNAEANVSMNLVHALQEAKLRGLSIYGLVGRDGGYTARAADKVVIVPTVDPALVTPHAEAFQAVIWHCLVSHPALKKNATKW
jgi:D-sedoheptulose 7-phosphate isomerase